MLTIRKAEDRGHAHHGWLNTHHTFSFANYLNRNFMGFSALRVLNDDVVAPGAGFGTHGHRDMEIVSYVLSGGLEHKDNMGNGSVIYPGEVQRMSAGTGILHSEYNASDEEPVNFLQIWIIPNVQGIAPGYEQKAFHEQLENQLRLVASPDGRNGSVTIRQDAYIYAIRLHDGVEVKHTLTADRPAYFHVAKGKLELNGVSLKHGDGVFIQDETTLQLNGLEHCEALLFDLP